MSIHFEAVLTGKQNGSAIRTAGCAPPWAPAIDMLFDVIQVCEISLSVATRQQFDAWARGPLHSLIPHFALLVWAHGNENSELAGSALLTADPGWPGLEPFAGSDAIRLHSHLRRFWSSGSQGPVLLDARRVGGRLLARMPDGVRILLHGVEPRLCGMEGFFGLICDSSTEAAQLLCITQLIAPYLQLAFRRVGRDANLLGGRLADQVSAAAAATLSAREVEILKAVRDGQSYADIASALGIGRLTVKRYLGRASRKLSVATHAEAVAKADSLKLLEFGMSQVDSGWPRRARRSAGGLHSG